VRPGISLLSSGEAVHSPDNSVVFVPKYHANVGVGGGLDEADSDTTPQAGYFLLK
jgi:hypothetical protein